MIIEDISIVLATIPGENFQATQSSSKIPVVQSVPVPSPTMYHFVTEMCMYVHSCCKMVHCGIFDLLHKFHNAPVSSPTMHHFVTEMCTFLLQNGALWDIRLYGICEMSHYYIQPPERGHSDGYGRNDMRNMVSWILSANKTTWIMYIKNEVIKYCNTCISWFFLKSYC